MGRPALAGRPCFWRPCWGGAELRPRVAGPRRPVAVPAPARRHGPRRRRRDRERAPLGVRRRRRVAARRSDAAPAAGDAPRPARARARPARDVAVADLPPERRHAPARALAPRYRGARTARARLRAAHRQRRRRRCHDDRAPCVAAARAHALPARCRASRDRCCLARSFAVPRTVTRRGRRVSRCDAVRTSPPSCFRSRFSASAFGRSRPRPSRRSSCRCSRLRCRWRCGSWCSRRRTASHGSFCSPVSHCSA